MGTDPFALDLAEEGMSTHRTTGRRHTGNQRQASRANMTAGCIVFNQPSATQTDRRKCEIANAARSPTQGENSLHEFHTDYPA